MQIISRLVRETVSLKVVLLSPREDKRDKNNYKANDAAARSAITAILFSLVK